MASSPKLQAPEQKTYLEALREAHFEEMARNPDMVCLGEDIGLLGGAFGVTIGLQEQFGPQRVIDMPISEAAIVGVGCGAALNGKTVVCEMQFIDFISCGFDQIVNMSATYHYRTAGEVAIPMVIRGPAGAYSGGGPYHSQMNEAWFANSPGLKIACPSTPSDAKGLMLSAMRDQNPVIFYEIKQLYRERKIMEELKVGDDALVPLGKAKVVREGADVTLVSYGQTVFQCLEAADNLDKEGFSAEVIDVRTLVPLDSETIIESLRKTNRIVAVNEAPMTCGFAGEILARISQDAFELLDAPPMRVTRMDTPVPWAKPLELHVLPSADKVTEAALRVCRF
jgi:2-oxoisovalerate dehydrogenase E1 component beta subunit